MENSIINSIVSNHNGWDECGEYGDLQLYDATLAIDTKNFKKGDMVECIAFIFSKGVCQIMKSLPVYEDGFIPTKIVEEFKLKLIPIFE